MQQTFIVIFLDIIAEYFHIGICKIMLTAKINYALDLDLF